MNHDTILNILDLISFVLVMPDIIGPERLQELGRILRQILRSGTTNVALAVIAVTVAASLNYLGLHQLLLVSLLASIAATVLANLFSTLEKYLSRAPASRSMLLAGASLFFITRSLAIFFDPWRGRLKWHHMQDNHAAMIERGCEIQLKSKSCDGTSTSRPLGSSAETSPGESGLCLNRSLALRDRPGIFHLTWVPDFINIPSGHFVCRSWDRVAGGIGHF